jgi:exodeoxyribonuclease III
MKIITWNVNSLRTRLARTLALLERHQPDVVCLQETKVVDDGFPTAEIEAAGYTAATYGQKTYNGVAILSRKPLSDVRRGFPGDPVAGEARVIAGTLDGLTVLNLYVVNGQSVGSDKYRTKLAWLDALTAWLGAEGAADRPLLVVGDFNIAPEDRDVHDPERWRGQVLCSDAERERLRALVGLGLADLLRLRTEQGGLYTWWDYRDGAFHRGWGLRIDLALGSESVAGRCRAVTIDREERKATTGEGKPSDHAPVIVELE